MFYKRSCCGLFLSLDCGGFENKDFFWLIFFDWGDDGSGLRLFLGELSILGFLVGGEVVLFWEVRVFLVLFLVDDVK